MYACWRLSEATEETNISKNQCVSINSTILDLLLLREGAHFHIGYRNIRLTIICTKFNNTVELEIILITYEHKNCIKLNNFHRNTLRTPPCKVE